ncbi:MAG: acyl-[acyl-carrier-protein] thioesterase [Lachnospiraceae bacterium]|nr:acyl-[acyl-carrier-protein] thioesterase [Lachnospiraceae bacterium]
MYSIDTKIRYSEIDKNRKLKPLALLNLLQDCCTFQSEDVGNTGISMRDMNRAWILNSWQVIVFKDVKLGDLVTVSTMPYEFKGFFGMRCFEIKDKKTGERIAIANSVWTYLNTKTGTPARIEKEIQEMYGIDELIDFDWAGRKIPIPENLEKLEAFDVRGSFIDTNNHVNNAWYVELAAENLPEDFSYNAMRVEYKKSAVLGDRLMPMICRGTDKNVVVMADEDENPYATVEFYSV